jgi:hypothetical protein
VSSTVAYRNMRRLAGGFEKTYRSAVCSGISGDRRHQEAGGYHIGRKFQSARNYSVVRPHDRPGKGPADGAAAVDITMGRRDMMLCTARLAAAWRNTRDPRRKYLNAFNGWDGSGSATRYDVYARRTKPATRDHKWHIHCEIRRAYILSAVAVDAIISIIRGESVATWLRSRGVAAAAPAARPAPKSGASAPRYPGRALRRNDNARKPDPAVRLWQQRMRERGWTSIGPADGKPGRRFETVAKRWQKLCKLPDDGVVGPKTWPTPWTKPLGS